MNLRTREFRLHLLSALDGGISVLLFRCNSKVAPQNVAVNSDTPRTTRLSAKV
jgi:hypothetical protein